MLKLPNTLTAWRSAEFNHILKQELSQNIDQLPLQQALSHGNYVADSPVTFMINRCEENALALLLNVDIFYQSIIAGCSCADDPTPISELNEHCSLLLTVDKNSALATWQIQD